MSRLHPYRSLALAAVAAAWCLVFMSVPEAGGAAQPAREGKRAVPVVKTVKPAKALRGVKVVITGARFGSKRGRSYVAFGTRRCLEYLKWSNKRIVCRVPGNARAGKVRVAVRVAGRASRSLRFTVLKVPKVLGPDTEVLTTAETATLTSVSADQSTLTFAGGAPEGLAVGEIVQTGACDAAPAGVLRTVTGISAAGGSAVVTTTPASLEEAYRSLDFNCSEQVTEEDLRGLRLEPGVRLVRTRGGSPRGDASFTLSIDKDLDGFKLSGSTTLSVRMDLNATIKGFRLKSAYAAVVSKEKCRLTATVSRSWHAKKEVVVPLGTLPMTVGGLPVLLNLDLVIGAKAELEVGASTGVRQEASFTVGASYADGKFSPVTSTSFKAGYDKPTLWGKAEAKAYVGPKVSATICGVAGPVVGVNGYGRFVADTTKTPWWKLHAGLEGSVGFTLRVFSRVLAEWEYERTLYDKVIARAPSGSAPPVVTFSAGPGTGAPPATLGPYAMQPFWPDSSADGDYVWGVWGPTGWIGFNAEHQHKLIGIGWATWSHGYTGDVYANIDTREDGSYVSTITLPAKTGAFYLYAEPDVWGDYEFTVSSGNASSGPVTVNGDSGATYFGFYITPGYSLGSIQVVETGYDSGIAIGEFGIATFAKGSSGTLAVQPASAAGAATPPSRAAVETQTAQPAASGLPSNTAH